MTANVTKAAGSEPAAGSLNHQAGVPVVISDLTRSFGALRALDGLSLQIAPGEFLAIEMQLPEFTSPIVSMGRVAYCEAAGSGFEVGIEFWWVGWGDDSAQRAISDYIKTELRNRESPPS